jgi:hypothetical protein
MDEPLEIPDAAFEILINLPRQIYEAQASMEHAGSIIVATQLRRLAQKWIGNAERPNSPATSLRQVRARTWFQAADELTDLANRLDPQQ